MCRRIGVHARSNVCVAIGSAPPILSPPLPASFALLRSDWPGQIKKITYFDHRITHAGECTLLRMIGVWLTRQTFSTSRLSCLFTWSSRSSVCGTVTDSGMVGRSSLVLRVISSTSSAEKVSPCRVFTYSSIVSCSEQGKGGSGWVYLRLHENGGDICAATSASLHNKLCALVCIDEYSQIFRRPSAVKSHGEAGFCSVVSNALFQARCRFKSKCRFKRSVVSA